MNSWNSSLQFFCDYDAYGRAIHTMFFSVISMIRNGQGKRRFPLTWKEGFSRRVVSDGAPPGRRCSAKSSILLPAVPGKRKGWKREMQGNRAHAKTPIWPNIGCAPRLPKGPLGGREVFPGLRQPSVTILVEPGPNSSSRATSILALLKPAHGAGKAATFAPC